MNLFFVVINITTTILIVVILIFYEHDIETYKWDLKLVYFYRVNFPLKYI